MERNRFEEEMRRLTAGAEVPPSESVWSAIESDLDRNQFEGKFKKALEHAEEKPSGYSWSVIESELMASENIRLKGRVKFYQRLAAASVFFAALLGASGLYFRNDIAQQEKNIAALNSKSSVSDTERTTPSLSTVAANGSTANGTSTPIPVVQVNQNLSGSVDQPVAATRTMQPVSFPDFSMPHFFDSKKNDFANASMLSGFSSDPRVDSSNAEVKSPMITEKNSEVVEIPGLNNEKKDNKYREDLWAGLTVSAGNYSPSTFQNHAASGGSASRIVTAVNTQSSIGSSYSVGLSMGKRVAARWVLLGGINYMNQSQGYTSNTVANNTTQLATAFLSNYSIANQGSVSFTSPYQINNVLEFISVPVQAGYMFIDRKVGLQMNAGLASDFFLRNTLQDPSGQLGSLSQSAGSESPYRSVNFAGLVSTELSVRMSRQYRISVVPGFRYMLNPALKAGVNNPYIADIGFRFRYILK